MAKWIRKSDGSPVLETDTLKLNKSMRLLSTDLGQQLLREETVNVNEVAQKARDNGFEDYKGGAGPSPEMAAKNVQALGEAIEASSGGCAHVYLVLEVDGEFGRSVTYDRWGFSTLQNHTMDQAGLEATIAYLTATPGSAVAWDRLEVSVNHPGGHELRALLESDVDGGFGEFDAPADSILRAHFQSEDIAEWECMNNSVTEDRERIVFHGLRIVWAPDYSGSMGGGPNK